MVADALSKRYARVSVLGEKLLGLQAMQSYYFEVLVFQDLVKDTLTQGR